MCLNLQKRTRLELGRSFVDLLSVFAKSSVLGKVEPPYSCPPHSLRVVHSNDSKWL